MYSPRLTDYKMAPGNLGSFLIGTKGHTIGYHMTFKISLLLPVVQQIFLEGKNASFKNQVYNALIFNWKKKKKKSRILLLRTAVLPLPGPHSKK